MCSSGLVSDIPANKLNTLNDNDFFKCGDCDSLEEKLKEKLNSLQLNRKYDLGDYNWDKIAQQTIEVYKKTLDAKS